MQECLQSRRDIPDRNVGCFDYYLVFSSCLEDVRIVRALCIKTHWLWIIVLKSTFTLHHVSFIQEITPHLAWPALRTYKQQRYSYRPGQWYPGPSRQQTTIETGESRMKSSHTIILLVCYMSPCSRIFYSYKKVKICKWRSAKFGLCSPRIPFEQEIFIVSSLL